MYEEYSYVSEGVLSAVFACAEVTFAVGIDELLRGDASREAACDVVECAYDLCECHGQRDGTSEVLLDALECRLGDAVHVDVSVEVESLPFCMFIGHNVL